MLFRSHGRFRYSMINQGFDLVELNLKDMNDIPSNINILLIAEMRSSMSSKEQEIIDRFLERGGNMMIMGDVGRQEVMNPLLRKVGLKLLPGIIAQPSDVNPGDLVLAKATQIAADSIGGFYKRMVDRQLSLSRCSLRHVICFPPARCSDGSNFLFIMSSSIAYSTRASAMVPAIL